LVPGGGTNKDAQVALVAGQSAQHRFVGNFKRASNRCFKDEFESSISDCVHV